MKKKFKKLCECRRVQSKTKFMEWNHMYETSE